MEQRAATGFLSLFHNGSLSIPDNLPTHNEAAMYGGRVDTRCLRR